MAQLLLIRHGESTWNALRRWQGHADPPLSDVGVDQAQRAAAALRASGEGSDTFDAIWTSDLQRASATAQAIADVLGIDRVITHVGLRERAAGSWEGLTRDEIDEGWPGWLDTMRRPEGFEDDAALLARLMPALEHIATRTRRAVIVAHGGVIRALDRHCGGPDAGVPNLAGRWLQSSPAGWVVDATVDLAAGVVTDVE